MLKTTMLEQDARNAFEIGDEESAKQFLKLNSQLVYYKFETIGGHAEYVLSEFPLGSSFVADFVVAVKYSGAWNIHFIELEPPKDMVITKARVASKRLAGGLQQLRDWRDYISQNEVQVKEDLNRWFEKRDILKPSERYKAPSLKSRGDHIRYKYHLVIGRRASVEEGGKRASMNSIQSDGMFTISTYDKFLDIAKAFDEGRHPGLLT
jgi:Domain of unknown function (DUF4263)